MSNHLLNCMCAMSFLPNVTKCWQNRSTHTAEEEGENEAA